MLLLFFVLMLAGQQASAQEKQMPSQKGQRKPMGNMPMDPHSMKDCMEHQQAAMKSIDDMNTTMEAAKQSNDPDKMRAAIDHAQKQLLGMNEHMTMCRNMMSMMEKMQGMGEMMKGGSK